MLSLLQLAEDVHKDASDNAGGNGSHEYSNLAGVTQVAHDFRTLVSERQGVHEY